MNNKLLKRNMHLSGLKRNMHLSGFLIIKKTAQEIIKAVPK